VSADSDAREPGWTQDHSFGDACAYCGTTEDVLIGCCGKCAEEEGEET
jgi:hypothetical protein